MTMEEKQIEGRLSLLYAISLFGHSAPISRLKQLFQTGLGYSDQAWDFLLQDIRQSELVNQPEGELVISDNGMVVLSFFQDRIPPETIQRLHEMTAKNDALTTYEWQIWYDARLEMLHIMQLRDHRRILSLQFELSPEDAAAFTQLEFPDDESVLHQLHRFLLTSNIKSSLPR